MEENSQSIPHEKIYKPTEIIGIFEQILSSQNAHAPIVYIRGIYKQKQHRSQWLYCYDSLKDEDTTKEITLKLSTQQRSALKDGNVLQVGGILNRKISENGIIQLVLEVSRIDVVQNQAIDTDQIKRMELRQKKANDGFKNVDSILEHLLFTGERPKIALLFAQSSITMSDFAAGIQAAMTAIDFFEFRANFANSNELISTLTQIDGQGYTAIAIVQGGGSGIEKLDDLSVLEAVINLQTPTIGAIGHVEEKLFIKECVDKVAPTPNGLGQYFSNMVESISDKQNKSRAALTEQIKQQFNEQIATAKKQNEELQKQLSEITKSNDVTQKRHSDDLQKLQEQIKLLNETHAKQQEQFSQDLRRLQQTNYSLNTNITMLTNANTKAMNDLNDARAQVRNLKYQLSNSNRYSSHGTIYWKIAAIIAFLAFLAAAAGR